MENEEGTVGFIGIDFSGCLRAGGLLTVYDTEEILSMMRVARRKSDPSRSATETNCPGSTMNPKEEVSKVAGTSTPAGASPSRPVMHQQGRVGCKLNATSRGEERGLFPAPSLSTQLRYIHQVHDCLQDGGF